MLEDLTKQTELDWRCDSERREADSHETTVLSSVAREVINWRIIKVIVINNNLRLWVDHNLELKVKE